MRLENAYAGFGTIRSRYGTKLASQMTQSHVLQVCIEGGTDSRLGGAYNAECQTWTEHQASGGPIASRWTRLLPSRAMLGVTR
jgi:hypothetical protein